MEKEEAMGKVKTEGKKKSFQIDDISDFWL